MCIRDRLSADCSVDFSEIGTATATDNCTISPTLTFSEVTDLNSCNGTGTITRTWKAVDACGNESTCDQLITISETTNPTIICPVNAEVILDFNCNYNLSGLGSATATDNCTTSPIINFSDVADLNSCSGSGTIIRTWKAIDACGNESSCEQLITIIDATAPVITCPTDVEIEMDASCTYDLSEVGSPTATDNCTASPTFIFNDGLELNDCGGTGIIVRTWQAVDACGNESSCEQIITISETTNPSICLLYTSDAADE